MASVEAPFDRLRANGFSTGSGRTAFRQAQDERPFDRLGTNGHSPFVLSK